MGWRMNNKFILFRLERFHSTFIDFAFFALKGPSQPVCIACVYYCYYPGSFTNHPVKDVSCQSDSHCACCWRMFDQILCWMDSKTETNTEFAQDSRPNMKCYGSPVTSHTQDELAGVQANLSNSIEQPIVDWIVSIVDTFYLLGSGRTWLYEFWVEFPCKS